MTANELLNSALDICGLRTQNGTIPAENADLVGRALTCINVLTAHNAAFDARITRSAPQIKPITALTDNLPLSDILCYGVLPFGLAWMLMSDEDRSLATMYADIYENARREALNFGKPATHAIKEVN